MIHLKTLRKYFLNGVITIVPIGIVVFVVVQVFHFLDNLLGNELTRLDHYSIPGLGLLITLILITIAGALATHWMSRWIFQYADAILKKVPLVKGLYGVVKDTIEAFFGQKHGFQRVVLVDIDGAGLQVLGLVTRDDAKERLGEAGRDKVAVYIPMSFQMSGLVLLVPTSRLTDLELSVEDGIKYTLSAGLAGVQAVKQWSSFGGSFAQGFDK